MVDGRAADNGNGNDDVTLPGGGVFRPQLNELGATRDDSKTEDDAPASGNPFFDEYASDRRAPGASSDRAKPTDQPVLVQQRVSDGGRVINDYQIYAEVLNISTDSRGSVPASVEQMEGTGERLCHYGHGSVRPGALDGQLTIPIGGRTNYYGAQTHSSMYRGDQPNGDGQVTEQQIIAGLVSAGLVGRGVSSATDVSFPISGRNPGYPVQQGHLGRTTPSFATPSADNSVGQPFRGGPDNFNNRFVSATERHHTVNENSKRASLRSLSSQPLRGRKGYDS